MEVLQVGIPIQEMVADNKVNKMVETKEDHLAKTTGKKVTIVIKSVLENHHKKLRFGNLVVSLI